MVQRMKFTVKLDLENRSTVLRRNYLFREQLDKFSLLKQQQFSS